MLRKTRFFLTVTFCSLIIASVEAGAVSVTYIANEGFLLESGGKKVLVDALFGKQDIGFCDVPGQATLDNMAAGEPPFDSISVVLVTHDHFDHFDAGLAAAYLFAHPHCQLIGTNQVADKLKSSPEYEKIEERIRVVVPPFGSSETLSLKGIDIVVLRLKHNSYFEKDEKTGERVDLHRDEENIGFLITIGDARVLHVGDSGMENVQEYEQYHLEREKIDIAFLGTLFVKPVEPKFKIVNNYIRPDDIVVMHLGKSNKDLYFALGKKYQEQLDAPMTMFKTPLENKVLGKD